MKNRVYPLLIVIIAFLSSSIIQAQNDEKKNVRTFEKTLTWQPEEGKNGCDATIYFKLECFMKAGYSEDLPCLNYTAIVEKGSMVYFNGEKFSKSELGDEAYNAIRVSNPSFTADIYDGDNFIKTIAFSKVGEEDYHRMLGWGTIFEGDYLPDSKYLSDTESKSVFLSSGLNFKNIQLTNIQATNFHLVNMYALDKKKN